MDWTYWIHDGWQWLLAATTVFGYVLTLLLLPVVLLTKKRWPVSTVAWVMAIVTLPYLGALLFLIFGINRVARRVRNRQAATQAVVRLVPQLATHHLLTHRGLSPAQAQLLRLAERLGGTKATSGNRIEVFSKTTAAFASIEEAIAAAEHSIHLEYYIWQPDRLGTKLRDLLIGRAKAGVTVRFLYDALGSMKLTGQFLQPMRDAGIHIASFVPGQTLRERWSINLRSHRKIVLVDGAVGFTGGMNVGDEYLGQDPHFGYWRDTFLRMEGPTVLQLQEVFAADWYYATGEELFDAQIFPPPADSGRVDAQVLAGGPDTPDSVFHELMFAAINTAREQVTLATSYFVPTPSLESALESAAYRGVRTRVLVSGAKTYWHAHHAARSYYDELLRAGVEIYEYRRGKQHAKTLTVDGSWALVGSPNFDARSVFLNFEVGVAIYDTSVTEQIDFQFDEDLRDSVRVDPQEWSQRSVWERLKESWCRMFSPIL